MYSVVEHWWCRTLLLLIADSLIAWIVELVWIEVLSWWSSLVQSAQYRLVGWHFRMLNIRDWLWSWRFADIAVDVGIVAPPPGIVAPPSGSWVEDMVYGSCCWSWCAGLLVDGILDCVSRLMDMLPRLWPWTNVVKHYGSVVLTCMAPIYWEFMCNYKQLPCVLCHFLWWHTCALAYWTRVFWGVYPCWIGTWVSFLIL